MKINLLTMIISVAFMNVAWAGDVNGKITFEGKAPKMKPLRMDADPVCVANNEIAPRTHNSAHFSIEACSSSQFDQYICISSGINPPEIKMHCEGSIMINLLGLKKKFPISIETRRKMLSQLNGSNLHWYGKTKETVGRKMAHITFLLSEKTHTERIEKSKEILSKVREIWPSPNA